MTNFKFLFCLNSNYCMKKYIEQQAYYFHTILENSNNYMVQLWVQIQKHTMDLRAKSQSLTKDENKVRLRDVCSRQTVTL